MIWIDKFNEIRIDHSKGFSFTLLQDSYFFKINSFKNPTKPKSIAKKIKSVGRQNCNLHLHHSLTPPPQNSTKYFDTSLKPQTNWLFNFHHNIFLNHAHFLLPVGKTTESFRRVKITWKINDDTYAKRWQKLCVPEKFSSRRYVYF